MKNKFKALITIAFLAIVITVSQVGCKTPEAISSKSGNQLWSENCGRCHNAPSSAEYSNGQWEVLCNHMRVKAGLTETEVNKIVEFLKGS